MCVRWGTESPTHDSGWDVGDTEAVTASVHGSELVSFRAGREAGCICR